jgi:hypothetical protein
MILKGSQRGGAKQLAHHLLKTEENEHVEVHEVRGFMSDDLHGALKEIHAVSQGTRCKQFMFSLSLSPPQTENVPIEYFENALADIEKEMKLEGQPRVVVFHEKEGRRHAHCVWSRINTEEMKAINLPYYKYKLRDISKQLYFQHGWQMPRGLMDSKERNPLNFTLAEWQQAKRLNEDPKILKTTFQECWAISDSGKSFAQALKERGFYLAKGDRRGFVVVDFQGEVFSLSRWIGVKNKELKNRLGDPKSLPTVERVKAEIAKNMTQILELHIKEVHEKLKKQKEPLLQRKQAIKKHHQKHRTILKEKQEERWNRETVERSKRLLKGLKGIWHRITGKYQKIRSQNELEMKQCQVRDKDEKQAFISRQLKERQNLQGQISHALQEHKLETSSLRKEISRYIEIGEASQITLQEKTRPSNKNKGYELEI